MFDSTDPPASETDAACACGAEVPCCPQRIAATDFACMPADVEARVAAMGQAFDLPDRVLRKNPGQWLDLLATCSACPDRSGCGNCVDAGAIRAFAMAGHCPNAARFAALANLRRG